ncbi:MAG: hypothetical protein AB1861_17940 [Cyanobacteriota bacterium]
MEAIARIEERIEEAIACIEERNQKRWVKLQSPREKVAELDLEGDRRRQQSSLG